MPRCSTTLSDRELAQELTKLAAALAMKSKKALEGRDPEHWKARKAALEQLQKFAEEDVSARPIFAQMLSSTIKVPLLEQLSDQRSAILRAACQVIAAFARCSTNRVLWASMCVWLVRPLLNLTASAATLVVEAAHQTLQVMAGNSGFAAESLGELLKGCRTRHAAVRLHAMRTLLTLMREAKGTTQQVSLAMFHPLFSRVILSGVTDADQRVRKVARQCYWGLYAMEPAAASEIYASFGASTKALVEQEKVDALQIVGAVEATGVAAAAAPSAVGRASGSEPPSRRASALPDRDQHTGEPVDETQALHDDLQAVAAIRARTLSASARRRQGSAQPRGGGADRREGADGGETALSVPVHRAGEANAVAGESALTSGNEWNTIQDALVSTDWEMRRDAVESLSAMMKHTAQGEKGVPSQVFTALIHRISDPHFRVCLTSIRCLRELMSKETMTSLADPHLHDTLLALFACAASRKESVQQEAAAVLLPLLECVEPDVLLRSLLACLDDITAPVVRVRILEALQVVFHRRWEAFAEPPTVGLAVRALVHQLRSVDTVAGGLSSAHPKTLTWLPAAAALKALHQHVAGAVTKAILALDGDDQVLAQRVLEVSSENENRLLLLLKEAGGGTAVPSITDRPRPSTTRNTKKPSRPSAKALQETAGRSATAFTARLSPAAHEGVSHPPTAAAAAQAKQGHSKPSLPPPPQGGPLPSATATGAPRLRTTVQPTAEGTLFPTEFIVDSFVDPNEPNSASYPYAVEEAGDNQGFGSGGGAATASTPLMRGRRHSATAAASLSTGAAVLSSKGENGLSALTTPHALLERLCSPDSTGSDLCVTLDSVRTLLSCSSRDLWSGDDYQELLAILFERLCTEHGQPQHAVRRRAFSVLRALLETVPMRPVAARHLSRVLRACRAGLDDAFYDVQQEASLVMHTVLRGCNLPVDLCLNGLAGVVETWQRGQSRDDCTRGWLEMLSEMGRVFEQVHAAQSAKVRNSDPNVMMTEAVLRRVARVVHWCASHCAAEVRRTSVLVLVAMWLAMDKAAFVFFSPLSATQRRLVSIYHRKALAARQHRPAVNGPFDDALRDVLGKRRGLDGERQQKGFRDLNAEMVAAGYPEPPSL